MNELLTPDRIQANAYKLGSTAGIVGGLLLIVNNVSEMAPYHTYETQHNGLTSEVSVLTQYERSHSLSSPDRQALQATIATDTHNLNALNSAPKPEPSAEVVFAATGAIFAGALVVGVLTAGTRRGINRLKDHFSKTNIDQANQLKTAL